MKETLNNYIKHARDFEYMGGVERDRLRVKEMGEVFTPTYMVNKMLDMLDDDLFKDPTKSFMDNSCGDGQFLSEIIIRKMEKSGCSLEDALSTVYGVELMDDNINICLERLSGPNPSFETLKIVKNNIIQADALTFNYKF